MYTLQFIFEIRYNEQYIYEQFSKTEENTQ